MGSDPTHDPLAFGLERWSPRALQGTVELPAFLIGRFEVTVAQLSAFVAETGHPIAEPVALDAPGDTPATFVAWTDALAYARWLDDALRRWPDTPRPIAERLAAGWRVTLPSEAEWEKAARGDDGRIYPWGDAPEAAYANYEAREAAPVGSFRCEPCVYGLADMAGNVWEWTRSPYQPYPFDETDDRDTLGDEALWVMRGGSFEDGEQMIRSANRGGADPGARRRFIGFRVVISPS